MIRYLLGLLMATHMTATAHAYKGLYVDNFTSIINNPLATDSLLDYAQKNNYTTLSLYDLYPLHQQYNLTSSTGSQVLASFISKAKTTYGIQEVTAIGENYWFFNTIIHAYNQLHSFSNERIDVYNLEFEFWNTNPAMAGYYCSSYLAPNNLPCTVQGAYSFFLSELQQIHALAQNDGCITETYLGWPDSVQAVGIIPHVDRVFIHAYITNPSTAFGYTLSRLEDFGSTSHTVEVIPLFSSEPSFLGPWLANNAEADAFSQYMTGYNNAAGNWKEQVNIAGYQWFKYSTMPYTWPEQYVQNDKSTRIGDINAATYRIGTGADVVNIFSSGSATMKVYLHDMTGRLVLTTQVQPHDGMARVNAEYVPGIYIVTITDAANGQLLHREKTMLQ